jgi:copper chaperone
VLTCTQGVESYTVSLETQTAEIQTTNNNDLTYEIVRDKIKKTGKAVKKGWADGEEKDV